MVAASSRLGIYYYYIMYGNRRTAPPLCKQKKNAYIDSFSSESLGGGTRVQYDIL